MLTREDIRAVVAACIGALALAISAAITASAVANSTPHLTKPCVEIYEEYKAEVAKGAKGRELVLPGVDGRSMLDSDPDAKACGITAQDLSP